MYLRNLPQKKKKNSILTNVRKRVEKKKNPGINPGQPDEKRRKKIILILTLGNVPEEKGEKKNPDINPRQPVEKKKKTP
jgi:hypothetical protein